MTSDAEGKTITTAPLGVSVIFSKIKKNKIELFGFKKPSITYLLQNFHIL